MLGSFLLAMVIGIFLGIITGLIPGIHVNLISVAVLSLSPLLLQYATPLQLAIAIASMAVTHTFLDVIPSIYLGAPDPSQILAVLPGHRMLLNGHGYKAVYLTIVGSLSSIVLATSLVPLLMKLIIALYSKIRLLIPYLLMAIAMLLILREKNRIFAFFIFSFSGLLGLITYNSNLSQPLFPLLSGLFGIASLLLSLKQRTTIPRQMAVPSNVKNSTWLKAIAGILFAGTFASFLPGLGPAQAAVMASTILRKLGDKGFLILTGGLSTINMVVSFITLYTIEKARNGAVVVISKILPAMGINHLLVFVSVSLITGGIAALLALTLSRKFSSLMPKLNYKAMVISIITFISVLSFVFDGFLGIIVLATATSIGLLAPLNNVSRHHLMASIMLPVILFLL